MYSLAQNLTIVALGALKIGWKIVAINYGSNFLPSSDELGRKLDRFDPKLIATILV